MLHSLGEARIGHELFADEREKLDLEERNAYRLAKAVHSIASVKIHRGDTKITPAIIRLLHRFTIRDIYSCAGHFRDWPVKITGSFHKPPREGIGGFVEMMCETANEMAESDEPDPIAIAAFLLWRLNWIHPFGGGNGRTSRALSYLAICVHLGEIPEGKLSIAEQIDMSRDRYQSALEDADMAARESSVTDVRKMAELLEEYLTNQIQSAE